MQRNKQNQKTTCQAFTQQSTEAHKEAWHERGLGCFCVLVLFLGLFVFVVFVV